MEQLKGLFNIIMLLVVVLGGASLFIPQKWEVYKEQVVQAPPDRVYPYISDLKQWNEWHSWVRNGKGIDYPEHTSGEGAIQARGELRMEILEAKQDEYLSYRVDVGDELAFSSDFILQSPELGTTKVIWRAFGNSGYNPVKRFYSLYYNYMLGKEFEESIIALRHRVERR